MQHPEPYITTTELANLLNVSERTINRMRLAGMPSVVLCKRTRRYLASEAIAWAQCNGANTNSVTANVIELTPHIRARLNTYPPAA